jgi:hypothetical protein
MADFRPLHGELTLRRSPHGELTLRRSPDLCFVFSVALCLCG